MSYALPSVATVAAIAVPACCHLLLRGDHRLSLLLVVVTLSLLLLSLLLLSLLLFSLLPLLLLLLLPPTFATAHCFGFPDAKRLARCISSRRTPHIRRTPYSFDPSLGMQLRASSHASLPASKAWALLVSPSGKPSGSFVVSAAERAYEIKVLK
jgi:hypothetical protein